MNMKQWLSDAAIEISEMLLWAASRWSCIHAMICHFIPFLDSLIHQAHIPWINVLLIFHATLKTNFVYDTWFNFKILNN